jgi:hypothetical protein
MTRGKAMSDDLRGVLLNMARTMGIDEICHKTGCKKRTVERVMEDYRKKGTVMREHLRLEMRGAKRSMTAGDVNVCPTLHTPHRATEFCSFLPVSFDTALMYIWTSCGNFSRTSAGAKSVRQRSGGA